MRIERLSAAGYRDLIQPDRVHGSLYTEPYVFEDELDKIFSRGWVFVAHDSELPNPGDYITRTVGRQHYLVVRGRDGAVNVFINRCQHRGNLVCNTAAGNARHFTCPYHGWTFGLNGELQDVPHATGFQKDWAKLGLEVPRSGSYRGFVFASAAPDGITLDEHLGRAKELIDRACDLSPNGRLRLSAGWVRHQYSANWKMLPENDTDGYHVGFAHQSFVRAIRSQYDQFVADDTSAMGVIRDWGNGHTEIDFAGGYTKPLEWLGISPEKAADYVAAMETSYGRERAAELLRLGPPHACIWPNLFLAETNIVIFQPLAVNKSVQWHTPMLLEGAPDLDFRLLRQSEGALGPASFLVADDASIAERGQLALEAGDPWCDLSRGLAREETDARGVRSSHMTDETSNRGFWQHYLHVMAG
ncbi:aromatic ring-hydroxylating oxygenase subunit alpha [Immundisolibacter sp.]